MFNIIKNNILDLAIVILYLLFVVANKYDPTVVYDFLAHWDTYYTYITWCLEISRLQEQLGWKWWKWWL